MNQFAGSMLPWGSHKGPVMPPPDSDLRPGEYVMRLLFTEFTVQAERKMEAVMAEPQVNQLYCYIANYGYAGISIWCGSFSAGFQ